MEIDINFTYASGARCLYSVEDQCVYKRPNENAKKPTGLIEENNTQLCGPQKKAITLPQIDQDYWTTVATEQITGCDKYYPIDPHSVKIAGPHNELANDEPTNRLCKYNPNSGTGCSYLNSYRFSLPPTGASYLNGNQLCEPKLFILKTKGHEPLEKLKATDYETNLLAAAVQQKGCERYQPGRHAVRAQTEFKAPDAINELKTNTESAALKPIKKTSTRTKFSVLESNLHDKLAHLTEREGIIGDIFNDRTTLQALTEGLEVTGFRDIKDLDALVMKLIYEGAKSIGVPYVDASIDYAGEIKSFLAKQGFIGTLKDINTRIMINKFDQQSEEPVPGSQLIQLLIEAGLYSSGKGRIDTYLGTTRIDLSRANKPKVTSKYKHLTKTDDLLELALMLDSSTVTYEEIYRQRLMTVVSAGLPSLGKRK